MRVEPDIELAIAHFSRRAGRCKKILIARRARCRRIWTTEPWESASARGTWQQLNFHVNGFAARSVRHNLHTECLGAIHYRANGGDFRIGAARRLVISRLATIGIRHRTFVDIEIVIRFSAAGISPTHRDFDRCAGMGRRVARRECHRQHVVITRLRRIIALWPRINLWYRSWIGRIEWPSGVEQGPR